MLSGVCVLQGKLTPLFVFLGSLFTLWKSSPEIKKRIKSWISAFFRFDISAFFFYLIFPKGASRARIDRTCQNRADLELCLVYDFLSLFSLEGQYRSSLSISTLSNQREVLVVLIRFRRTGCLCFLCFVTSITAGLSWLQPTGSESKSCGSIPRVEGQTHILFHIFSRLSHFIIFPCPSVTVKRGDRANMGRMHRSTDSHLSYSSRLPLKRMFRKLCLSLLAYGQFNVIRNLPNSLIY